MKYLVKWTETKTEELIVGEEDLSSVLHSIVTRDDLQLTHVGPVDTVTTTSKRGKYIKRKKKSKEYVSLNDDQIQSIRTALFYGTQQVDLARAYNVSKQTILNIKQGKGRFSRYVQPQRQPQPVEMAA